MISLRRIAATVCVCLTVASGSAVVAPGVAHAALRNGSWTSPYAGQRMSGTVNLMFDTPNTAVTFVFPDGSTEAATVSGSNATGTWDSTRSPDGTENIGAKECDTTGCMTTEVAVDVVNPVAATPAPTPAPMPTDSPAVSPAAGALDVGRQVTVSGTRPADITYDAENGAVDLGLQALPFTLTVPNFPNYFGSHTFMVSSKYPDSNVYAIVNYTVTTVPAGAPKLSNVSAPVSFFPHKDGFEDSFSVALQPDRAGTARLNILSGKKVVAHGSATLAIGYAQPVTAGAGLKPGKYTWSVTFTDVHGKKVTTKPRPLTADPRAATGHRVTTNGSPSALPVKNYSGSCASVTKAGSSVELSSQGLCNTDADNLAEAFFYPTLKPAAGYSTITMRLETEGDGGEVNVFENGTPKVALSLQANQYGGTATSTAFLNPSILAPGHQLQFAALLEDGTLEVTRIQLSYTYYVLVK